MYISFSDPYCISTYKCLLTFSFLFLFCFLQFIKDNIRSLTSVFYVLTFYLILSKAFLFSLRDNWGFPGGSEIKNPPANTGERFCPWIRKIPWRRKWQPTPVFLPGKSHGQRRLVGYGSWGHKESDTIEHAPTCMG